MDSNMTEMAHEMTALLFLSLSLSPSLSLLLLLLFILILIFILLVIMMLIEEAPVAAPPRSLELHGKLAPR